MHLIENDNMEFKREYTPEIKKEIVAFANSQGGTILIGIEDDGSVSGLPDADKVMLQISGIIQNAIKPDLSLFTECKTELRDGKNVVAVSVQRGSNRPYYIAERGLKPSGVYLRLGSACIPASEAAIRSMIKETDTDSFENSRSMNQELTFVVAEQEFQKRNLDLLDMQKKNLGLIGEDGLYTNLGLLLSDQCTHTIKAAVFQGNSKTEFRDRREFKGSILKQLVDVYEYIDLYNKTHAEIKGLLREDTRDYPQVAIRETLLNAVVHRDYTFHASTLISIFDNRIETVTLGGLVPGLSLDAIKMGASQSRNEKLAHIFYRLKLIEAYGTGIAKIMDSYANHSAHPDLRVAHGAFVTVLPNLNAPPTPSHQPANPEEEKIVALLVDNKKITRYDVEALFCISQTTAGNLLRRMEKAGVIKKIGKGKNTAYVLTSIT